MMVNITIGHAKRTGRHGVRCMLRGQSVGSVLTTMRILMLPILSKKGAPLRVAHILLLTIICAQGIIIGSHTIGTACTHIVVTIGTVVEMI